MTVWSTSSPIPPTKTVFLDFVPSSMGRVRAGQPLNMAKDRLAEVLTAGTIGVDGRLAQALPSTAPTSTSARSSCCDQGRGRCGQQGKHSIAPTGWTTPYNSTGPPAYSRLIPLADGTTALSPWRGRALGTQRHAWESAARFCPSTEGCLGLPPSAHLLSSVAVLAPNGTDLSRYPLAVPPRLPRPDERSISGVSSCSSCGFPSFAPCFLFGRLATSPASKFSFLAASPV